MCGPARAHMVFKLLSDFDGVWTDQASEARAVRVAFVAEVARILARDRARVDEDFEAFYRAALADPSDNGWAPGGELTAFVDEDPLLATASVAGWLDRGGVHPSAEAWRRGLSDAGYATAHELANACFGPAAARHRSEGGHSLVPGARAVIEELRSLEVELVVVSNSFASKLTALFADAGIDPARDVRIIGDAGKWRLGDGRDLSEIGARYVRLDRPHYRRVLEQERPDLVVGDVLSLDLALPSMLRFVGALDPALQLALRRHGHTPDWTLDAHRIGVFDHVIESVQELPDLVRAARR
jgi:phosphoglycolate phosphatase-like HAD superfamily hydrolase